MANDTWNRVYTQGRDFTLATGQEIDQFLAYAARPVRQKPAWISAAAPAS